MSVAVAVDERGMTELHRACANKTSAKVVAELLSSPSGVASVNVQDNLSMTPLFHLLRADDPPYEREKQLVVEIVQLLIDAGADVNVAAKGGKERLRGHREGALTALHCACRSYPAAALLLLTNGANVNATGDEGTTPLHQACLTSEDEMIPVIQQLVSVGADINARDQYNMTPLQCCFLESSMDATSVSAACLLIDAGADLDPVDPEGMGPVEFVDIALNHEVDDDGCGFVSCQLRQIANFLLLLVPALIRRGVKNIDARTIGGKVLLLVMEQFTGDNSECIFADHIDPLRPLLGTNINFQDALTGKTAIHALIMRDDVPTCENFVLETLKGLRKRFGDINVELRTKTGLTALHGAAKCCYAAVVAYLIGSMGAEVNTPAIRNDWMPLHFAVDEACVGVASSEDADNFSSDEDDEIETPASKQTIFALAVPPSMPRPVLAGARFSI